MKQNQNCRDERCQGLRECLAQAKSIIAITALLRLGVTFKDASDRTRRAWDRTAERRTSQLGVA